MRWEGVRALAAVVIITSIRPAGPPPPSPPPSVYTQTCVATFPPPSTSAPNKRIPNSAASDRLLEEEGWKGKKERKGISVWVSLPPLLLLILPPPLLAYLCERERERARRLLLFYILFLPWRGLLVCSPFLFSSFTGNCILFLPHHEMKLIKIEQKHIRGLWVFGNCNCHFIRICLRYLPTMGAAAPPPKRIAGSVWARERTRLLFHLPPQCPPPSANPIFFSPRSIFEKKTSLGHNKGGGLFTLLKFVWEAVNSPPSYINPPLFFASKVMWETYASTQKIARTPHFPVDVKGEGAHFQFAQDDDRQNGSLFLGGRRSLLGSVVSR